MSPAKPVAAAARAELVVAPLPAVPERLPHTFEPARYAAWLYVDPGRTDFWGTLEIAGELAAPSAPIWLRAEDLQIHGASASRGGVRVPLRATQPVRGWLALQSEQPLAAGAWTLAIDYAGTWEDEHAEGGFRQHASGDAYVFTQFEPDFARRVFPCFDEPDRKVPWQLTLDVPTGVVAASNTPIESETSTAKKKTVRFAPTPPIPSYLVAFAVGPFDVVDAGASKSGIPIRILTQRGYSARAAHAAISAPQLFDRIESWLGVPFPYPKLDFVAVPETADWWGAMENPGLVTFHAQSLADPAMFDGNCAHEIAHHWFGDYVTPTTWDDIWLNESFAYWIGAKFTTRRRYDMPAMPRPLVVANLAAPRPQLGASSAHDSNAFMAIHKGARLLATLERALGDDQLVRVLRRYLTAHPHGSVHTADLRAAFAEVAGEDTAALVDRYAYATTEPLDVELRCTGHDRRVEVRGFGTTGLVCVAYDRDGTRDERCGRLAWGAAAIELPATRCPRWVLPTATEEIRWTQPQLEAIRDHGLSLLRDDERMQLMAYVLGHDPTAGRLRLSFIDAIAPSADRELVSWLVNYLLMIDPQVAPNLRGAWDAWLTKVFASRAPSFAVLRASTDPFERAEVMSVLMLLLAARAPAVVHEALALVPEIDKLDSSTRFMVLGAAVADRPALADELLAELPKASSHRMSDIALALRYVPDLLDVMKRHVPEIKRLQHYQKADLLGRLCDETRRGEVEELGKQIFSKWDPFLLRDYEWCIQERKHLEPELRAFLDGASGAAKRSHARR